jgi:hypothetical protein
MSNILTPDDYALIYKALSALEELCPIIADHFRTPTLLTRNQCHTTKAKVWGILNVLAEEDVEEE